MLLVYHFCYSTNIELASQKKTWHLLRKKPLYGRQGLRVHGTLYFLPVPLHTDKACLTKLFNVM